MAKLMLVGPAAEIELTWNEEAEAWEATCVVHHYTRNSRHPGCGWTEQYDTLDDASEYAADHADRGTR